MERMEGLSERRYAAQAGVSRGAIQKAKAAGRLVLHADGSIDAAASDARRAAMTDPSKQRGGAGRPRMKPVPETAVSAVADTLREQGLAAPPVGAGTTFLQAKMANEVLKAQERRLKLQKMKGELVDRARATRLGVPGRPRGARRLGQLAGPRRGADGGRARVETPSMQEVLESHVRNQLQELSDIRPTSAEPVGFDGWEDIARSWREGLRPDPDLTVSGWADRHRVLSSRAAPNPAAPPGSWASRKSDVRGTKPRIVRYQQATGLRATDDDTPWCASFLAWCLRKAGVRYEPARAAAARRRFEPE